MIDSYIMKVTLAIKHYEMNFPLQNFKSYESLI